MESHTSAICLQLLSLFLTSQTKASTQFSGIVCSQCHQWSGNTPTVNVGPPAPPGKVYMTEEMIDRKIAQAFQTLLPSNCQGARIESSFISGDSDRVLGILLPALGFKNVVCDVSEEGGNWTVLQRRQNGNVDFFRGWKDYVNGFGDLHGDFWLGLEPLHQMTKEGSYELKINMITKDGRRMFAKYSNFRIGPGSSNYILSVSGYSGNATDSLVAHNNRPFSTKDSDHDTFSSGNCASRFEGAWWYHDCYGSNLNGNFTRADERGIVWWNQTIPLNPDNLSYSEMKFRRRSEDPSAFL